MLSVHSWRRAPFDMSVMHGRLGRTSPRHPFHFFSSTLICNSPPWTLGSGNMYIITLLDVLQ